MKLIERGILDINDDPSCWQNAKDAAPELEPACSQEQVALALREESADERGTLLVASVGHAGGEPCYFHGRLTVQIEDAPAAPSSRTSTRVTTPSSTMPSSPEGPGRRAGVG